jgi:hypothetical protein
VRPPCGCRCTESRGHSAVAAQQARGRAAPPPRLRVQGGGTEEVRRQPPPGGRETGGGGGEQQPRQKGKGLTYSQLKAQGVLQSEAGAVLGGGGRQGQPEEEEGEEGILLKRNGGDATGDPVAELTARIAAGNPEGYRPKGASGGDIEVLSRTQLQAAVEADELSAAACIWAPGMRAWMQLGRWRELLAAQGSDPEEKEIEEQIELDRGDDDDDAAPRSPWQLSVAESPGYRGVHHRAASLVDVPEELTVSQQRRVIKRRKGRGGGGGASRPGQEEGARPAAATAAVAAAGEGGGGRGGGAPADDTSQVEALLQSLGIRPPPEVGARVAPTHGEAGESLDDEQEPESDEDGDSSRDEFDGAAELPHRRRGGGGGSLRSAKGAERARAAAEVAQMKAKLARVEQEYLDLQRQLSAADEEQGSGGAAGGRSRSAYEEEQGRKGGVAPPLPEHAEDCFDSQSFDPIALAIRAQVPQLLAGLRRQVHHAAAAGAGSGGGSGGTRGDGTQQPRRRRRRRPAGEGGSEERGRGMGGRRGGSAGSNGSSRGRGSRGGGGSSRPRRRHAGSRAVEDRASGLVQDQHAQLLLARQQHTAHVLAEKSRRRHGQRRATHASHGSHGSHHPSQQPQQRRRQRPQGCKVAPPQSSSRAPPPEMRPGNAMPRSLQRRKQQAQNERAAVAAAHAMMHADQDELTAGSYGYPGPELGEDGPAEGSEDDDDDGDDDGGDDGGDDDVEALLEESARWQAALQQSRLSVATEARELNVMQRQMGLRMAALGAS